MTMATELDEVTTVVEITVNSTKVDSTSNEDWTQAGKLFGLGFMIMLIWGFIILLTARRQLFRKLILKYCCCKKTSSPEKQVDERRMSTMSNGNRIRSASNVAQLATMNQSRRSSRMADMRRESQQLVLLDSRNSVVAATAPMIGSGADRRPSIRPFMEPVMVFQDETGEEIAFYPVQPLPISEEEESEEDASEPSGLSTIQEKSSHSSNLTSQHGSHLQPLPQQPQQPQQQPQQPQQQQQQQQEPTSTEEHVNIAFSPISEPTAAAGPILP